ncbi:MAG: TraB/GumN family protein [Bacteroidales bacterium]|nr:TraB/GumN family protein [Bacteroidales bacterium]
MRKLLLIATAIIASITYSHAQILYRISGNGLETPSYIVGTYHLAPASFADSIPGMKTAIEGTQQVCGELDMMDAFKPENAARLMQSQMLPEGTTLSSLLTAEQLERLNKLLLDVMGSNLNDEAFAAQIDKMTPAALSTTLSLSSHMKKVESFNPIELIDNYFQMLALQNGKAVKGFETVDFQMGVLFGAPLEKQVNDLMCMVDHFEDTEEMVNLITTAYFSQDLTLIEEAMEQESKIDCGTTEEDEDILINNRNRNWVELMPDMMAEQPTLFVVGAGHLCGEKGVLKLLEKAGYTIEGMKE